MIIKKIKSIKLFIFYLCYNDNGDFMKIEKMTNGKYKVYLDNEVIITTEEVIINTNLLYKENVTDEIKREI